MFDERIRYLNKLDINPQGQYVLYWMQQSCRISYNHALNYAAEEANILGLPLLVCFGITDSYPEANERHYYFLLEGIQELKGNLEEKGINFVLRRGTPWKVALELSGDSALTITDKGYLRIQREWRRDLKKDISVPLIQVESDLIVPLRTASTHEVERAYIMRDKLQKRIKKYLVEMPEPLVDNRKKLHISGEDLSSIEDLIDSLDIKRDVKKSEYFKGGYSEARKLLDEFISSKLIDYKDMRNIPTVDKTSKLSPYLHFGQISSLEIMMEIRSSPYSQYVTESFYNELVVWRELCHNFCYYNESYDSYEGIALPWVYDTLDAHLADKRQYIYSLDDLEMARTHDSLWNAAQMEMVKTGRMHGYMRIYWGKKIIDWSLTPATAYGHAIYLNNKYELDGRDPNGYGGIAWCFGKHDRPVHETPILGRVRTSSKEWLKRNFDIERYISWVQDL